MVHALNTLQASPRAQSNREPLDRKQPSKRLMAITMASAILGIVSASTAALASMNFIHSVQLRTFSRGVPRRTPPHLLPPSPQPALAMPPAIATPVEPESVSLLGLLTPPSLLAHAGGPETHDPAFLVARARRLADAGGDIIVSSVRLRYDVLDHACHRLAFDSFVIPRNIVRSSACVIATGSVAREPVTRHNPGTHRVVSIARRYGRTPTLTVNARRTFELRSLPLGFALLRHVCSSVQRCALVGVQSSPMDPGAIRVPLARCAHGRRAKDRLGWARDRRARRR
jgi:hypothetical protein